MDGKEEVVGNLVLCPFSAQSKLLMHTISPSTLDLLPRTSVPISDHERLDFVFFQSGRRILLPTPSSSTVYPLVRSVVSPGPLGFRCRERTVSLVSGSGAKSPDTLPYLLTHCSYVFRPFSTVEKTRMSYLELSSR